MAPSSGEAFSQHVDLAARRRAERSARRDADAERTLSRKSRTRAQEQRRTERDIVASDAVSRRRRSEELDRRAEERARAVPAAAVPAAAVPAEGARAVGEPALADSILTDATSSGAGQATVADGAVALGASGPHAGTLELALAGDPDGAPGPGGPGGSGTGPGGTGGAHGAGAAHGPSRSGDRSGTSGAAPGGAPVQVQAGRPVAAGAAVALQAEPGGGGGGLPAGSPLDPAGQPAADGGLEAPSGGGHGDAPGETPGDVRAPLTTEAGSGTGTGGGTAGDAAPEGAAPEGSRGPQAGPAAPGSEPAGLDTRVAEAAAREARPPEARAAAQEALAGARAEAQASRPLLPEQAAGVLKQVRLHLAGGSREATLNLQPAWLGRVSIRVAVRDGRARAEVRAERPEALQALERHLPELRAALAARGFAERGLELDLGLSGEAHQPPGERPHPWAEPAGRGARLALPAALAGPAGFALEPLRSPDALRVDGSVDTYA